MFRNNDGLKALYFFVLYWSSSQNRVLFYYFSHNFELTLDKFVHNNPFLLSVIGKLNAKSKWLYPLDKTTYEGNKFENITSNTGLHQLFKEATHTHTLEILSSCIDLIFTSDLVVVNSGIHSSLHVNCHHHTNVKFSITKTLLSDIDLMNLDGNEP